MLSFYNIWTVAKFEIKTLARSWFFRIFAALSVIILLIVNLIFFTDWTGGWIPRLIYANTGIGPYSNLLFFNLAQAIIAIFLASDFLKRDKKLDTTEAIYIRSITNSDYIIGKSLGIILIFILLNIVILFVSAIINLLNTSLQFNLLTYIYYPLLISLPTLIFIIGITFLLMTLLRVQAIVFILLLGYIGTTLFYLGNQFYHVLDYTGWFIPMAFSDFIGFGNLSSLLLHRGAYFLMGLSFIFITVYLFKRLPQSDIIRKLSVFLFFVTFLAGISLLFLYINRIYSGQNLRSEIINLNTEYHKTPRLSITDCEIQLKHTGDKIQSNNKILLNNKTQKPIDKVILSLNPGLKVTDLSTDGDKLDFIRKIHLIIFDLKAPLLPGDSKSILLNSEGVIDDEINYLDINENLRARLFNLAFYAVEKKYSILTKDYVLLTSENLWYPQSGVTFTPESQFTNHVDFINFSLNVSTKENLKVISQGLESENSDKSISFKTETPLPKISLIIGPYEKRSAVVDSVEYNLFLNSRHNYFDEYLSEISDTLAALIREVKQDYERELQITYPFNRFSIVETPIQYETYNRIWTTAQESIQPEMVFLPENGLSLDDADFKQRSKMQERFTDRSNQVILPRENQSNLFKNFVNNTLLGGAQAFRFGPRPADDENPSAPYKIFPNYFTFTNNFSIPDLPIFNIIIENYLKVEADNSNEPFMRNITALTSNEKAAQILNENSLKTITADTSFNSDMNAILRIKSSQLFTGLEYVIGEEKLRSMLNKILEQNRFKLEGYNEFKALLLTEYKLDFESIIDKWYNSSELPGYFITKLSSYKVLDGNRERYQVKFNITNAEDSEGYVKIDFDRRRGGGGRRFGSLFDGSEETTILSKIISLAGKQSKMIALLLDEPPSRLIINTLLSKNLPLQQEINFEDFEENKKISPVSLERIEDNTEAFVGVDDIIVDNEDPGFKAVNPEEESFLKKLLDLSDEEDKYIGLRFWDPPENWRATIMSDAYGKFVHSVLYTKAGAGNSEVEWNCDLSESGYYDIYTYMVKPRMRYRHRHESKTDFHYNVYHDDGIENLEINYNDTDPGWNLLGSYYLSEGPAKVVLTNKSTEGLIFADALKWVKRK